MGEQKVSRHRFIKLLGAAGSALVGLSIAATPRNAVAILSRSGKLTKITALSKLKAGVNGPYSSLKVDTTGSTDTQHNTNQIYLVYNPKNKKTPVVALEATCRHMGCPVQWISQDKKFECPCHGSQYNMAGKVVQGPAQANLYTHKVTVKAGQVWVMTTRNSK
jgi:cytochrome b6-f complex iron-sulfur subunit